MEGSSPDLLTAMKKRAKERERERDREGEEAHAICRRTSWSCACLPPLPRGSRTMKTTFRTPGQKHEHWVQAIVLLGALPFGVHGCKGQSRSLAPGILLHCMIARKPTAYPYNSERAFKTRLPGFARLLFRRPPRAGEPEPRRLDGSPRH